MRVMSKTTMVSNLQDAAPLFTRLMDQLFAILSKPEFCLEHASGTLEKPSWTVSLIWNAVHGHLSSEDQKKLVNIYTHAGWSKVSIDYLAEEYLGKRTLNEIVVTLYA